MRGTVKRSIPFVLLLLLPLLGAACAPSAAQLDPGGALTPDLADLVQSGGLRVVNRGSSVLEEPGQRGVRSPSGRVRGSHGLKT
jgi:hypothetical protein